MFSALVVLSLVAFCSGGELKYMDVEFIPKELRTVGADIGRSLSLGLDTSQQRRQNFINLKDKNLEDQSTSGSEFYAPVYVDYDELQKKGGASYRLEDTGDTRGEVGFYGSNGRKGSGSQVSEEGYAGDHKAARGGRVNSGYYDDNSGARKIHDEGRASYGDRAYNRKGQAAVAIGSRGGHHKGHHSSGFKNTYHKDESGNNSRFFDDANDEGGHYLYDARDGIYIDNGADAHHGGYEDGQYQGSARGKQGKFGTAAGYDDSRGYKGRYAQDDYHDDNSGYNQHHGSESFGKNLHGGRSQEAGSLYHKLGGGYDRGPYYGSYSYSQPAVIGGYISPTGTGIQKIEGNAGYIPKAYYPEKSYPVPYQNFYKGTSTGTDKSVRPVVNDELYDGLKGKGYSEYEETGPYSYSDKRGLNGGYSDEQDYYRSFN